MRLIDADALLIKIDEANYTAIDIKNLIAEAQTVEQDSGEAVAWVGYKPQSNGTYFPVLFLEKPNPINLINIEPLYTSPPKSELAEKEQATIVTQIDAVKFQEALDAMCVDKDAKIAEQSASEIAELKQDRERLDWLQINWDNALTRENIDKVMKS